LYRALVDEITIKFKESIFSENENKNYFLVAYYQISKISEH